MAAGERRQSRIHIGLRTYREEQRYGGRGCVLGGDIVKKGMLAREKTDKDKACVVS